MTVDEQTGQITIFCDAESHERWSQVYSRRGDGPWLPELFQQVGEDIGPEAKSVLKSKRGGGVEWIDAAGRTIRTWVDLGHADSLIADIGRARSMSGTPEGETLPVGRRYQLRCPLCGDALRRSDSKLQNQLTALWERGESTASLKLLRAMDRMT